MTGALVDPQLRGLFADGLAESVLPVNHGDGIVLEHDLDVLVCQHLAGADPVDVVRDPNHAVRVVADQVGFGQVVADALGFAGVGARGGED